MKSIFFARHSYAESSYDKADFDREITQEGFIRIEEQSELIKKHHLSIDLIICSSARRTKQTSEFLKSKLQIPRNVIYIDWLYEDYPTYKILDLVQQQKNTLQSIMIIAHNPTISVVASNFNKYKHYEFIPGGIVKMDFNTDSWQNIEIREAREDIFLK